MTHDLSNTDKQNRIQFEYMLYCFVPWDMVICPNEMSFQTENGITVRFWKEETDEGSPQGSGRLFATATRSQARRPTGKLARFLLSIEAGALPIEIIDPATMERLRKREPEAVDTGQLPKGRLIPDSLMPTFFRDFLEEERQRLVGPIEQILDLLAFRTAGLPQADGLSLQILHIRSREDAGWCSLPQGTRGGGSRGGPIPMISDAAVRDVQDWLATEQTSVSTAAHSLFREAWGAVLGHPRAAFLTAFTALETACKEWIAVHVQDVEWLIRELPSPPVARLLGEMIVPIARRLGAERHADQLERLQTAVIKHAKRRNDLVHGRAIRLPHADAKKAIREMEEVFWLLQCVAGVAGAEECLSTARARH